MKAIIGQKKEQTQKFLEDGKRIPVTMVTLSGGNVVTQVKTTEKEGYDAIQLGFKSKKKGNKPLIGHVKKASLSEASLFLREVGAEGEVPAIGSVIKASDVLKPGDIVDVIGISKGKGYAGGVKRFHFKGGPRTHGQSDRERAPGSIGQSTTPGRVYRGKRMAGRMGHEQVTVSNLLVVDVTDSGVLIKGLVPGPVNNLVMIKKVGEAKKFVPLYKEISDKQEEIQGVVAEAAGSASVSDDAQPTSGEASGSETASLSENGQSDENIEPTNVEAVSSSSENESTPVVSEDNNEQPAEKEEVAENASK
ncbi:MAG: 50S ribosomal protein L3 [Candidatus Levybacteria bacterium]|nr:50S ribosomal protein L3 [Candidatus Levybacteria bacterium]